LDAAETATDGGAILVVTEGVHGGADEAVSVVVGTDRGADVGMSVDVGLHMDGGADTLVAYVSVDEAFKGIADLSYSLDVLANFISFFTFLSFPVDNDIEINISSLLDDESDIIWDHQFFSPIPICLFLDADRSFALKVYSGPRKPFYLSKEPLSYAEAIA
jgi:hypothetical protein